MGIKRVVDMSFWTNWKIDDFSPEDKYFYLYLMTNPFSTQLGIYEISIKQAAFQLGYSVETVRVLLERFQNKYGLIIYDQETGEIAIKNYLRHAIVKGGTPVRDCLIREIRNVKNKDLVNKIFEHIVDDTSLNETVRVLITEYEQNGVEVKYSNEINNDKCIDNDNEESTYDSGDDTSIKVKRTGSKNQPFRAKTDHGKRELDEDERLAIQRMMQVE